jgi:hypothetical protein
MNCCSILLAKENRSVWLSGLQKTMQQITIVSKNIEETFVCYICAVKLKSKYYLERHIEAVHNNVKNFVYYICTTKFSFKFHLQRHIETVHGKINDFKCNICTRHFGFNYHHIRTVHENSKNFECSFFNKNFGQKSDLLRHIKAVHNKIKEF